MSLRARLMLGLLALAAVGLVILDAVSYTALRSYLVDRVDQQASAATFPAARFLQVAPEARRVRKALAKRGVHVPSGFPVPPPEEGAGIAGGPARGRAPAPPPTRGEEPPPGGPPAPTQLFPAGTFAELRNARGKVVATQNFFYGGSGQARPSLPPQIAAAPPSGTPDVFTVAGRGGSAPDFRAAAQALPNGGGTVVVVVLVEVVVVRGSPGG